MPVSVLLLESHADSRVAYSDALTVAGFRVAAVEDANEAYDAALAQGPEVIVACFDDQCRDDRFSLCERLKENPTTRTTPILVTSTAVDMKDMERATSTGVLALAVPPLDGSKLVSAIQGVLAAHSRPMPARATLERSSRDEPARSA